MKVTERVSTSDSSALKISNLPFLITSSPWTPKREFLAIPNGWRHKLQFAFKLIMVYKMVYVVNYLKPNLNL
ncbi:hypothetical protein, partial [Acinetobacter baumannii]|uniref:hypothetical protein n=2 Tax=Acinetobacter baumannii TaxID=470 RepID=UPI001BB2DAB2